jgi:kynurenine formamidase
MYTLTRLHGMASFGGGVSAASDAIAMGTHTGTHIDSIFHVSKDGKLHGDIDAADVQTFAGGIRVAGMLNTPPVIGRGLLLDIAELEHVKVLPNNYRITPDVVARCLASIGQDIRAGDVVLFRTGWDLLWEDPTRFLEHETPGPTIETARLLASRGVKATGSDTSSYEAMPSSGVAVHVELLVQSGIPIMECLNLKDLSERRVRDFQFVASPLNIPGATGSPITPIAIF